MKEMTASEILRDCARRSSRPELAAAEYYFHEAYVDDYTCDLCSLFRAIADKIDAELSQARELSLRAGAELWAKDNGWPDFRDGEDFGAWLDRCFIPRPRFEGGEPVQFGELVSSNLFGAVKVSAIEFTEDGTHVKDEPDGDWSTSLEVTTSRLKRPAPEVLGADGKPIKVGDAMWSLSGAGPLTVTSLHTDDPTPDGGDSPWADLDDDGLYSWIYAGSLTHTPPDTQAKIDADAKEDPCAYFGRFVCEGCPADKNEESCDEIMILDLLRRQRELDARKGGE